MAAAFAAERDNVAANAVEDKQQEQQAAAAAERERIAAGSRFSSSSLLSGAPRMSGSNLPHRSSIPADSMQDIMQQLSAATYLHSWDILFMQSIIQYK